MTSRPSAKRGALCVDEEGPEEPTPKRLRVSKKDVGSFANLSLLIDEATGIFTKMLGRELMIPRSKKEASSGAPRIDPRLLNHDILYTAALKKYLKTTLAVGDVPTMDDLHNISIAVDTVIIEEKKKAVEATAARSGKLTSINFKTTAARMAVALWSGACQTPYLANAKRGADSFRPFCIGAYYAMKRGLKLPDGTVLVPRCDELTRALPSSRTISATPALKSLHASSHRGLCTIHRCIASVDPADARAVFAETIKIASTL